MRLKILLLFLVVTCQASSRLKKYQPDPRADILQQTVLSSYEILHQEWETFKTTYNKTYDSEEDLKRMQIFAENKLLVEKHNDLYKKGVVTFTMEMNKFADLTTNEFNEKYGLNTEYMVNDTDVSSDYSSFLPLDSMVIPKEIDWRKYGAVTRVKDQKHCGSCWAFSAIGALEGQLFRKTGRLVEMSEQNLVDCSFNYGNAGCQGGSPTKAFNYAIVNHGIDTEKSYPYEGRNGKCRYKRRYAVRGASRYKQIPKNEKMLKKIVAAFGPVSVLIDASYKSFHLYKGGIYFNAFCSKTKSGHAVVVVGYGVDKTGDYWLVKNSWGADWGLNGYIKMARNRNNNCGIVTEAVIPIFE